MEQQMLTEKQKRDFCAYLLKTYGIQIDINNELLPVYYLAYSSASLAERSIRKATESFIASVDGFEARAQEKLDKIQPRQYHFSSSGQAFFYSFGKFGLPATLAVVLGFVAFWLWFNRDQSQQQASQIQAFLRENKQIASFQDLSDYQVVQDLKIGNQTLEYIQMPVVPSMRQAQPGKNVVVEFKKDERGNPSAAVIKIPLRVINK